MYDYFFSVSSFYYLFKCIKTVDESINELVTFVRSLVSSFASSKQPISIFVLQDPQDICVQLKYCNETMLREIQPSQISPADNVLSVSIEFELFELLISLLVCIIFKKRFSQLYFMQNGL